MENTPTKQPTAKALAVASFKKTLENNFYQQQLRATLKENAGTFCTSLMELVTGDQKLLSCQPTALMAEAVKAASLHLPLNKQLGYAYLVPFNNKVKGKDGAEHKELTPTLVIGWRGYVQLAMRTGQYETINYGYVYEGEFQSRDRLSGAFDINGEKTSDHVAGYFAYFSMKNGFKKMLFMTSEEMARYAKKYSPTLKFSALKPDQLMQLADTQALNGPAAGVGWTADYLAMAQKTVLRRLLSKWGYLSIEMQNALAVDEDVSYDTPEVLRNEAQHSNREVIDVSAEPITEPSKSDTPPDINEPNIGTLE